MIFTWWDEDGTEIELEVKYVCPYCDGFGLVPLHITPDGNIIFSYCEVCDGIGTIDSTAYWLIYLEGGKLQ